MKNMCILISKRSLREGRSSKREMQFMTVGGRWVADDLWALNDFSLISTFDDGAHYDVSAQPQEERESN